MGRRRGGRRSLACFIQALEGTKVVVELRCDTIVRGTLLGADEQLNLQLTGASYQPLQGRQRDMGYLYIRGRQVRYIHLPGNLDPAATIEAQRRRVVQAIREHAAAQQTQAQLAPLRKGELLELGGDGRQGTSDDMEEG